MKTRKVTIRGRTYRLKPVKRLKNNDCGVADAACLPNPRIRIRRSLKGKKLLRTYIHETLHGADWGFDEEFVEIIAKAVTRVLWTAGYRLIEEK